MTGAASTPDAAPAPSPRNRGAGRAATMAGVRIEPVTPEMLVRRLVARIDAVTVPHPVRVLVDGPPPARPGELADALTDPLRTLGRPVLRVSADDFLRPASLRYEHGRRDADAYYTDRLDTAGLTREVLEPLGPGGTRRYLPTLWDPVADRATRASYVDAPAGAVLLLDGAQLLGVGLAAELVVHLDVSPAALERRTPAEQGWTLPAYRRYAEEVAPADWADVVVRYDDPAHPALVNPSPGSPPGPR